MNRRASAACTDDQNWGLRLAVAGCVLCCGALCAAILYPVFKRVRDRPVTPTLSYAKQIALAMAMYANDWDDRFPPELSTQATPALLTRYLGTSRPQDFAATEAGYTWNEEVQGLTDAEVYRPADTWLFHATKPDGRGKTIVAFVDGRVDFLSNDDLRRSLAFGHDLSTLGANVHQIWRLPKESGEPNRQVDLTKPDVYTAVMTGPGSSGKASTLCVVRGPYSAANNLLRIGRGTSVDVYRKARAGDPWVKVVNGPAGFNRTDTSNEMKAITVDGLKDGKPVTGKDAILVPTARTL
jgi:hypothetical protein